jgi:hypothetical protein
MLTVEDGTGLDDAESYVDADAYRAFWIARADSEFDADTPTDAELEADLREAFAYVNRRRKYRGAKVAADQAGAFPRNYLYDDEGNLSEVVPPTIEEAQIRAARAHRAASLFSTSETKGGIASEAVDGVVSRSYFEGHTAKTSAALSDIDALLDLWSVSAAGSVRLVRG